MQSIRRNVIRVLQYQLHHRQKRMEETLENIIFKPQKLLCISCNVNLDSIQTEQIPATFLFKKNIPQQMKKCNKQQ